MPTRLKIGLVLPSTPGYSETFIWSKIEGLMKNDNIVSLFVNHHEKSNLINIQIPVYSQPDVSKSYLLPMILLSLIMTHPIILIKFIWKEKISNRNWSNIVKNIIINAHILNKKLNWIHFEFATTGIGRENVAKAMGIKSSVSLRGYDIGLYPYQHTSCYSLLWKKIDKVHTISDDLYIRALSFGLNPLIPFKKIPPAINISFFKSDINEELHNPLRILTVGRLTWKKGYEYALKALSLLKDNRINFEYHIVGDGNYREAILYAIHQLKLTDNVILKGKLSQEGVKKEMEWADIYIQPSIQEGFCNAVLEAQSMGLLCIVSNADGLPENVLDGKTGWVVKKRNPISIFEKIIFVIDTSVNKLNKVKTNSKNRVLSNFNIYLQHDQWAIFFNE